MMKNGVFIFLLLIGISPLMAQQRTYEFNDDSDGSSLLDANKEEMLVITFDDRMYRSDVDRELGKHNELNQAEIQRFFQNAMTKILMERFSSLYNVSSMNKVDDSSSSLLSFIHQNIKYEYEPMDDEEKGQLLSGMGSNKADRKGENGITNGQITSNTSNKEGFMNAYIKNDTLLSYLDKNRHFDYLILLNEFDLTYLVNDPQMAAYGGIQKKIKAHYTIYSRDGKMMISGAAEGVLANEEKNIYKIASTALPQIADKILLAFAEIESKEDQR